MPLFRRRSQRARGFSMFDIPVDAYDPSTQLPRAVKIGEHIVSPFVSIQNVQDYLIILAAFHHIQSRPNFPQVARQSAMQYQIWAQTMLPYYQERRVERAKGIPARYPSPKRTSLRLSTEVEPSNSTGAEQGLTASPVSMHNTSELPIPPSPDLETAQNLNERTFSASTNGTAYTDRTAETEATLVGSQEEKCDDTEEEQFLPPLNVLMAWHAHALHSYKYARELENAYSALADYPFPLREAAQAILDGTLPEELDVYGPYTGRYLESTIMDPLDIAAAMHHNVNVIDMMHQGGWLRPEVFDSDKTRIQKSILRYHAWLDVVRAAGGTSSLVSSLDIDLVWRVHQLDTFRYIDQTESCTGVTLSGPRGERYSDSIARKTSKLWKSMFGLEYQ